MEAWQVVLLSFGGALILFLIPAIIIVDFRCTYRYEYDRIKKYVRQNKSFDEYEIDRRIFRTEKEYELTKQLLKDNNYELVEEPEVIDEHIFGIGTVEFADGTIQYDVYTSRNSLHKINPKYLDYYKEHLGQTIQLTQVNKVYKRVEK